MNGLAGHMYIHEVLALGVWDRAGHRRVAGADPEKLDSEPKSYTFSLPKTDTCRAGAVVA